MCSADVSKAFLQGLTYEEIAKDTGAPLREAHFEHGCVPSLRHVEGLEDFNPSTEMLHSDKPGTGLKDAPHAFSLKLARSTAKFGCRALHTEHQI